VVLHEKIIGVNIEDDDSTLDTCLTPFSNREEKLDDVFANHNDNDEGELINIIQCNLFYIYLFC